jgi:hypothetical protein
MAVPELAARCGMCPDSPAPRLRTVVLLDELVDASGNGPQDAELGEVGTELRTNRPTIPMSCNRAARLGSRIMRSDCLLGGVDATTTIAQTSPCFFITSSEIHPGNMTAQ